MHFASANKEHLQSAFLFVRDRLLQSIDQLWVPRTSSNLTLNSTSTFRLQSFSSVLAYHCICLPAVLLSARAESKQRHARGGRFRISPPSGLPPFKRPQGSALLEIPEKGRAANALTVGECYNPDFRSGLLLRLVYPCRINLRLLGTYHAREDETLPEF